MAEQSIQDLEQAAKYRPGAVSQIANLLTGGLYGMASGATQKSVDAERARQALFQENLQNRLMQRQRMEGLLNQAAEFGIPKQEAQQLVAEDPASLTNRMNDIKMRRMLSEEAGKRVAQMELSGEQGPIQMQAPVDNRAFSLGKVAGQKEFEKEQEDLNEAKKTAETLGITVPAGANTPAIKSLINQQNATFSVQASIEAGRKPKEEEAKEYLKQVGEPVPESGAAAIVAAQRHAQSEPTRAQQGVQRNLDKFYTAVESGDQNKIREAYSALPPSLRSDPKTMESAGINPVIPPEVRKEIPSIMKQYEEAGIAARAIADLVGSNDYRTVSRDSFNELTYKLDKQKDKFFKSDAERDAVNEVIQAFSTLVSSGRKTLFGASLTSSELAEAQNIWAKNDSADFLPRALRFIDRVHSRPRIKEMSETYSGVSKKLVEDEAKYLSQYDRTVSNIKGFRRSVRPSATEPAAPAAGGTNAPAAGKTTSGKGFKIISE